MDKAKAWAAVFLVVVIGALLALNFLFTAHYFNAQQASEQRAGELVEQKLCVSFEKLGALQPPAGNPVTNPSRGFDQKQHVILDQLGIDLGCHSG